MQISMVVFTLSLLDRKQTFWANFAKKNKNCQFKLKFGTGANSNMQNSMVTLIFFVLYGKHPSWANLPKNQNYQFKLRFGTYTNLNMENSIVLFTFSALDWKHPFWTNLVQKIKIVSLS